MSQFFTLPTKIGQGLISNAIAYNEPLTIATMAIGDGGGTLPSPDASVTRLVNEVRRGPINQITTDPDNPNWIIAEQVLPPDVGGWTIREVGLYDAEGNLIAYGNYPETYKPQLSEGSSRTQTIRFVMETTDTGAVTLKIDPAVVMASRKYVDDSIEAHAESRNHPLATTRLPGFVQYGTADETREGKRTDRVPHIQGMMAAIDANRTFQNMEVFDSAGIEEWDVPEIIRSGKVKPLVTAIGAGAGGHASFDGNAGGSGGGGGGIDEDFVDLTGIESVTMTIGKGGVGGRTDGSVSRSGENGESTSFGSFLTATGGRTAYDDDRKMTGGLGGRGVNGKNTGSIGNGEAGDFGIDPVNGIKIGGGGGRTGPFSRYKNSINLNSGGGSEAGHGGPGALGSGYAGVGHDGKIVIRW